MNAPHRIREIPYNYTSFSDREIVLRLLGSRMWTILEELRSARRTGRSARMLLEVLGDLWIVTRNPLLEDDLAEHPKRLAALLQTMKQRLDLVEARANGNTLVLELVARTRQAVAQFSHGFARREELRATVLHRLSHTSRRDNIDFSAAARIAQVTDATDWRVELPFVVLAPDREEETLPMVQACIELGLTIIPRGGGTGYTGSAIPLHSETALLNTEKLDFIDPVVWLVPPGLTQEVPTIRVGAGAVTKRVADAAQAAGCVFAVDPTSQNSSTIGGNIAMNAGGKKAVLWGTTLDNLLSWRMVDPQGRWMEITRLDHNLGKIHDVPEAVFRIQRLAEDGLTPAGAAELLTLPAHEIRKPGLGKDVTNKALGGLPGVQKEGCDGLVTSAVFLLHRMPRHIRTVCLEFFGHDLNKSVPAIVEIKNYLDRHPQVKCAGLEHLDERYVRAVDYNTKGSRRERPKMVLLADVVGEDAQAVADAAAQVVALAAQRGGEGFIAVTDEGRQRFWADRSRTAAIARHTNAFKINEDVVIPLEQLAAYTEGIERINIEQSIRNKLDILRAVTEFLKSGNFAEALPAGFPASQEGNAIVAEKIHSASLLLEQVRQRWEGVLTHLETPLDQLPPTLRNDLPSLRDFPPQEPLLRLLLRHDLTISYRSEVAAPLGSLFDGGLWSGMLAKLREIHAAVRSSRLFAALHMHAGDGNVHTNIPVNSNDYAMLQESDRMVDRIMALAKGLGGVISGEHGVGMTKLKYMDPDQLEAFARYKQEVDPHGHFNRDKLLPGTPMERAYTPSLRLVQQEALILRESALGDLNDAIRNCLRCGKCKWVCSTHVPRANLLYSPRNKILAAGLVIEAFLYEEQTRRGVSIRHFWEMNALADHCTICRRCATPCPVDIDFGEVTVQMRHILKSRGKRRSNLATRLALRFLTTTSPRAIRWLRRGMILGGYHAQKLGHTLMGAASARYLNLPPATHLESPLKRQVIHLLERPLPAQRLLGATSRTLLGLEDHRVVPILRDPARAQEHSEAVFYFPGCGCERLFSDIALASLALLCHLGVQTVLPPGYLCCGFPQTASGDKSAGRRISTDNRVLFHRVANTLSYLEIKTVLVSCGTCLDQLRAYEFEKIFPGSRLLDVHEYLLMHGLHAPAVPGESALYHDPCHSPIRQRPPLQVVEGLLGVKAHLTDRCCGESGTFAVARPDIATQVRFAKEASIKSATNAENQQIFTTCPSCLQGLSRYGERTGTTSEFLAVEAARRILGDDWRNSFLAMVKEGGIERVLL